MNSESSHDRAVSARAARTRIAEAKRAEEQRLGLRVCKNCGPLPLADFYQFKRGRQCRKCIISRTVELLQIKKMKTKLEPIVIRPYQPKLRPVEHFPKPDSLFEVTKVLQRAGNKVSGWKAA